MRSASANRALVRALLAGAFALAAGAAAAAHDMWIEPSSYMPQIGRTIGFRLRVGQDFMGDPLPRDPSLIERFVVVNGDAATPVVGRDGADPAGLARVGEAGLLVVGYQSRPTPMTIPSSKFNQYLDEEGLEAIAALRRERGETSVDAREQFARCAKTLVLAGAPSASQHDRVIGLPLELVAERNPYVMKPGDTLTVRLLYHGQPIAGVLVAALNQQDPAARTAARTGTDGRVTLKLSQPGAWLVKAVHMTASADRNVSQWSSLWASLTFELGQ